MREIEKIIKNHNKNSSYENLSYLDMKEFIKKIYNLALTDAANNAEINWTTRYGEDETKVDKESILKLKI